MLLENESYKRAYDTALDFIAQQGLNPVKQEGMVLSRIVRQELATTQSDAAKAVKHMEQEGELETSTIDLHDPITGKPVHIDFSRMKKEPFAKDYEHEGLQPKDARHHDGKVDKPLDAVVHDDWQHTVESDIQTLSTNLLKLSEENKINAQNINTHLPYFKANTEITTKLIERLEKLD